MQTAELIRLNDVSLTYGTAGTRFEALKNINLTIGAGEHVAIVGKSGSGKSSLLNMINSALSSEPAMQDSGMGLAPMVLC